MKNFEFRRDRYESFSRFENPRINISMLLSLPDFRPFCRARKLPPFHFFLYCLLTSIRDNDNFMYRVFDGEVIKIDDFYGSYTVINEDNNLNYARFTMSSDLHEFIERSVRAGQEAKASRVLINSGADLSARDLRNNVYNTCMPWIDLRSIEHPIFLLAEADIPLFAWGKFSEPAGDTMTLPISVQAHHGFVDGYHIHQLMQALAARVAALMEAP